MDSMRNNLGLTFSYLYYHLFGVKWSSITFGSQHWNYFNLLVKQLQLNIQKTCKIVHEQHKLKKKKHLAHVEPSSDVKWCSPSSIASINLLLLGCLMLWTWFEINVVKEFLFGHVMWIWKWILCDDWPTYLGGNKSLV